MHPQRFGLIAGIVVLGLSTPFAQQQPTAPADLGTVVKILKDSTATDAQRERLVGQVYMGLVTVVAVRVSADVALLDVEVADAAAPNAPAVHMRFEGRRQDPKVQLLQRNQSVRIRGTLKSFAGTASARVPVFSDIVIESFER